MVMGDDMLYAMNSCYHKDKGMLFKFQDITTNVFRCVNY